MYKTNYIHGQIHSSTIIIKFICDPLMFQKKKIYSST